jgi:predicted amidohydrolase YtcJ
MGFIAQENHMKKLLLILFALILSAITLKAAAPKKESKADVVLRHGRIYTMDASRSWARSIAIKDGKIIYVGDDAGITPLIDDKTSTIELDNKFVLPGFIDSHVHPIEAGIGMDRCDLTNEENKDQVFKKIKECSEADPNSEWLLGSGWALPIFPAANPQKEWLDEIVKDRPVLMISADGHSAWANSKALEVSGVTKDTPDPTDGRIEHNAQGEPSGTLREDAVQLVQKNAPAPTLEQSVTGLQKAIREMNHFGLTGYQDAIVTAQTLPGQYIIQGGIATYREAEKRGILTAHVTGALLADPEGNLNKVLDQVAAFKKLREEFRTTNFSPTSIKIFEDGVIEANTAALLHPYLDKGNDAGKLVWEPEKLNPFVELLDKEKFQVHFHAIGDRAVRIALNALESARRNNGPRDARPILAHIELIDPADVPRFAQIGAIPCFQPLWAYEDSYITDLTRPKLGEDRMRWIYPMESVVKTGATMAFGSDWNVSSVNPLDGIEVAVTRSSFEGAQAGKNVFIPEERIDLPTALAAYTIGSAYANFWEKETGSLEVGKSAEVIVLDKNLFEIPPSEISEVRVLLTLFKGKTVYRDPLWR